MADSLIGLGSNLGDRRVMIAATIRQLQEHPDLRVVAVSRLHETRAVGGRGAQPAFLNAAARVETTMSPEQLLTVLQQVEERLGRVRLQRWDARTIDLDLLLYGQHILETAELVLPHPRMAFRRFVLEPAVEVAADMVHPATGWTLAQLLNHLNTEFAYVALVGLPGAGKTRLARRVSRLTGCRLVTASLPAARLAAFHADPSGRGLETQLEFLRLRARRLNRCRPSLQADHPAISDFWLDQTLVYSRLWLPESVWEDFEHCWCEVHGRTVRPKLLVFVNSPERPTEAAHAANDNAAVLGRLHGELFRQATLPRQTPLLKVNTSDFSWAVNEVTAALRAMQNCAT